MSAELAATFYTINYAQSVAQSMEKNQVDVLVLTPGQYMSILQDRSKNNPHLEFSLRKMIASSSFGQYWTKTFSPNAGEPWVGPVAQGANDVLAITKTLNAIGMAGITTYVKSTATGTYIIIKGYSGKRSGALTGTRYLATHPRMIQLGLGMKSLQGIAKGGFVLGVLISTGLEITDFVVNDEETMYDLVGGVGVEAVKGGLAGLVAYGVAGLVAGATAVAITPLIVMAFVAITAGVGLNYLEKKYEIKEKVVNVLKMIPGETSKGLFYVKTSSQSWLDDFKANMSGMQLEASRAMDRSTREWLCRISCPRY